MNFEMSGDQRKDLADLILNHFGETSPELQAALLGWKEQHQLGKTASKASRKKSKANLKVGPSGKRHKTPAGTSKPAPSSKNNLSL